MQKLPRWVVDNRTSVKREVKDYRDMSAEDRLKVMKRVCETAIKFAESHPDRDRVLAFRDPLPRSTVEALARLRGSMRRRS